MNLDHDSVNGRKCTWAQKLCYGMGHVYNDLCAAMWFSYTLFFLQIVLQMESKTAGFLIMTGQIVDSMATPGAGWAVDRIGARRAWHLAGTVTVFLGFSMIYYTKPSSINTWVVIYYGLVISLFQIGWAITQISHLSMIPEIANTYTHTSELTAIRYTASVCCNITVYVITLVILKKDQPANKIGPDDFYKFKINHAFKSFLILAVKITTTVLIGKTIIAGFLVLRMTSGNNSNYTCYEFKEIAMIITLIGIFSSLIFYCGLLTKENNRYEILDDSNELNGLLTNKETTNFLKSTLTYKVSLMYMASRLFTTLTLIYIPLYLDERNSASQETANGIRETIASIPLVCFIASFLTSIFLKYRGRHCTDKVVYLFGILLAFASSFWISLDISVNSNIQLYIIAALIGTSGSTTMVASLCLTAEFIKANGFGGASVYSIVTFTDKLISGGVVFIVQNLHCVPGDMCPNFYKNVLCYVCGTVSLVGFIALTSLQCHRNT